MEPNELKPTELKERLAAAGISVGRFAREANLYQNEAYRILAGDRVGPVRRARIAAAVKALGLTYDNETAE